MTNELPYQGPEWLPFEVKGYYEEFLDVEVNKHLGVRLVNKPDRLLGAQGRIEYTLTEPITLKKGTKEYVLKASPKRPIKVAAMLQILCGRTKELN